MNPSLVDCDDWHATAGGLACCDMCGRMTIATPLGSVVNHFKARPRYEGWRERYNVAPSQDVPIVRIDYDGQRELVPVRWGFIPSWMQGTPKVQPINARAEAVATSGMFRQAYERRRCLVAADGFYEWQKIDAKRKQPMYIRLRDGGLFGLAGLWERWKPDPEADPVETCTILTTEPNALMASIHTRMPVIIAPDDYDRWLDPATPGRTVADLLRPYPAEEMTAWPVATTVNSPRNDTPECIVSVA